MLPIRGSFHGPGGKFLTNFEFLEFKRLRVMNIARKMLKKNDIGQRIWSTMTTSEEAFPLTEEGVLHIYNTGAAVILVHSFPSTPIDT